MKPALDQLTDSELLSFRAKIDQEMRNRGIAYSVGEMGESLAIEYFNSTAGLPNLQKAPTGTKNIDAISRDGERYSIKTVCRGKKTGTVYPDTENSEKQLFEFILVAQLDSEWKLTELYLLSWQEFTAYRAWDKRMSAWYLPVSGKFKSACRRLK